MLLYIIAGGTYWHTSNIHKWAGHHFLQAAEPSRVSQVISMLSGSEDGYEDRDRLESASYGGMCDSPTLGACVESWPLEGQEIEVNDEGERCSQLLL